MKKTIIIVLGIFLIVSSVGFSNNEKDNPTTLFLNSLNKEQLEKTCLQFHDETRKKWHYLPGTSWSRPGIKLKELTEEQKNLFSEMLQSFLSKSGFNKVQKIIALEDVLAKLENNPVGRDSENYAIAIYGNPNVDKQWSWSFEGHHLSLNFTVVDDKISTTPRFLGANPAKINEGKMKGVRVLANEEDMAFELLYSLSEDQKKKAVFKNTSFPDIVTTNASEVVALEPVGIEAKDLNPHQQSILVKIINEYLYALPKTLASKRESQIKKEEFKNIRFGWAGALVIGKGHYYRIQGKTFLIEFDNTANNANHIHTVWRDFDGDFGRDILKEHYQNASHHKH